MNKLFTVFAALLLTLFSCALTAEEKILSDAEMQAYYEQLKGQIANSEAAVQQLLGRMESGSEIPSDWGRVQLESAISALEVKKILYANFYDTESVKISEAVRRELLRVMSQEYISEADLALLQSVVDREKKKLGTQQEKTLPLPSKNYSPFHMTLS